MSKAKMDFVPAEKRSKKAQRELASLRRGTWGSLNPVTRRPGNPKAYRRNAEKRKFIALVSM